MSEIVQAIPSEVAVRQRLAELASERRLLRALLRLSQQKQEVEERVEEQRRQLVRAS
jgi:hypothetical protein